MTNVLQGRNLYLIGMMGAGKTSVGQVLAKRLNYRFYDMDVLIERVMQQPIRQIFNDYGEVAFRQIESQVMAELSAYTNAIVATGGGIVLKRQNWSYLHYGIVVWLDVPIEELQRRLHKDTTRPLLQDTDPAVKLQQLFTERHPLYAQADLHVPFVAGESPEHIADRLLAELPKILKPVAPEPKPNP
ncbi:MAG: shikimate kinase [Leptolyngbyaceae cyanobacterium bins.59]|nr:shikimate kinase [Leptolyngbyaceae cyanobacterium bins.59]